MPSPEDPDSAGRSLPPGPSTGELPDPVLAQALADHDPARPVPTLVALVRATVVVAVRATLVSAGTGHGDLTVDKEADVGLAVLERPDGATALPVFSAPDRLRRWDLSARPVQVRGGDAVAAARSEGRDALVLDVAGPVPLTVDRPWLAALDGGLGGALAGVAGLGRAWLVAVADGAPLLALDHGGIDLGLLSDALQRCLGPATALEVGVLAAPPDRSAALRLR